MSGNIARVRGALGGRYRRAAVVPLAAVALVSAACGGPGGKSGSTAAAQSVNPTAAANSATTLTLFTAAGLKSYSQGLADGFHAKYPKISVKLQVEADNNYNTVLPRLLASSTPPDVAAPADLLGAVKDNLVVNLDSYAKTYGWASKVPSTVLDSGRVTNGVIGSGSLYEAGGAAGPLVGIFYNKALAQRVGMTSIPSSLADLEAVMAKAKSMGITPIEASNQDGLIGHAYSLLLASYMGAQKLLDVVWHRPGAKLDTPQAVAATTTLDKWIKAGYYNSDANAINQDASYGAFAGGKALFFIQGSWITQALPASFAGKYGIFPMPPVNPSGKPVSMTSSSLFFSIASHSKHQAAASLILDWLTTPEAAAVAVKNGYPSTAVTSAGAPSLTGSLTDQIQSGYSSVASGNGFTSWLQNTGGEMNTAETQQLQQLVAGKTTPAKLVASLQTTFGNILSGK